MTKTHPVADLLADGRLKDTVATRAFVRAQLANLRDQLATIAHELDTVDHDAARALNEAREDVFAAWSILREAPLEEREEWTPENADYCDVGSIHHY